ncbi:MAG: TIR domain-containing protein [Steroidobacteraceae bacterium]
MADIFVSYSRQDKTRVAPLVAALEAEGWSVWWDPDITPGEEFDTLISRELEQARALVVVWTSVSVESRWVRGEARDAADRGVLVPVRYAEAKLPIDFRAVHTTDLDGWSSDASGPAFRALCKALETKLGAPRKAGAAPSTERRVAVGICVLPFSNMSGDPEQDYFSDGITEDIITDLSKISALSIVSRNTAFSFKGKTVELPQVAKQTKASYVLEGSVRKAGNRVRITAQLINAANDAHVWAERYDRDLNDIFALQDEISKAIVGALKLTLLPEEKSAIEQRSTTNAEAYKLYLMARQFWLLDSERNNELCVRICKRVVELDPNYAQAWATLALAQWNVFNRGDSTDDGESAAAMALKLDPGLSDAHAAVAAAHRSKGRFAEGIAACEQALAIDPNSYIAHRVAGLCCIGSRRFDEAIVHFEAAAASLESDFTAASFVVQCHEANGDFAKAREAAKRAMTRIEKVVGAQPDHGRAIGFGVGMLASLGEKDRAREWVERGRLLDPGNVSLLYNFACAMVQLRDTETALELMQAVTEQMNSGMLSWIQADSDLDPIREEPRFRTMLEQARQRLTVAP